MVSAPHRYCAISCSVLIAVIIGVYKEPGTASAGIDASGSITGDNIEAQVRFDLPPDTSSHGSSGPVCTWTKAPASSAAARTSPTSPPTRTVATHTETLYQRSCRGTVSTYHWLRDDTSVRIAEHSHSRVTDLVPMLLTRTAPAHKKIIVNVPTWYWVPKLVWKPVTVTATIPTSVGPIIVTTTAKPISLIYSPGDGENSVSCAGPGQAWSSSDADTNTSDCAYEYRSASHTRSSKRYAARLAIQWDVRWKSNIGFSGTLPNIRTGLNFDVKVSELQVIAR